MLVTNIRKDGKQIGSLPDGEMHFHSDGSHRDVPYRATTLFAIKIPVARRRDPVRQPRQRL